MFHRLGTLQSLRAVAALTVVLYHASVYTDLYTGDANYLTAFSYGPFGILVFFALSGHLMAVQATKLAGRPMQFMIDRIVRIYPMFWLLCLVRIAVAIALGSGLFDPLVLMLSPVGERDYPLGVEWTLVYELAFYMIVCAVMVARLERWIALVGLLWLTSIIGHACVYGGYAPQFTTSLLDIPMSVHCGAFAAGLLLPTLLARGLIGPWVLPMGALTIATANVPVLMHFSTIIRGLGCAMLVGWAASLIQRDNRSPAMERMGDWSYALYLIHVPILISLGTLGVGLNRPGVWVGIIALILAVTPVFGMVDVAIHRKLKHALDRWAWQAQALLLTVFAACFLACMGLSLRQTVKQAESFESLTGSAERPSIDALERLGWHRDDRLAGHLETVARAGGFAYLSGWVNDTHDVLNRTSMLLLSGGTSTTAVPRSYRFDLIRIFGLAKFMAPTAFRTSIPDAACPAARAVLAVAISRRFKIYQTLNTQTCPA